MGGKSMKYKGMTDVLTKTLQSDGFKGLYRGILPNMIKLAPAAGISWFTFEEVKRVLGVDMRS
jgi:solute carrier family 25 phosphate transporter 23/24/25/41